MQVEKDLEDLRAQLHSLLVEEKNALVCEYIRALCLRILKETRLLNDIFFFF